MLLLLYFYVQVMTVMDIYINKVVQVFCNLYFLLVTVSKSDQFLC